MSRFILKTNDILRCEACGSKEFQQTHVDGTALDEKAQEFGVPQAGMDDECWINICNDCGQVMICTMTADRRDSIYRH